MPITYKGDEDNTCMVFNCNQPRHKDRMCFQHYAYHNMPSITSFEGAVDALRWGLQEIAETINRGRGPEENNHHEYR